MAENLSPEENPALVTMAGSFCLAICRAAEANTVIFGRQAILNGTLNAYLNIAHAYGVPIANIRDILTDFAADLERCYAELDADADKLRRPDLASITPQGCA